MCAMASSAITLMYKILQMYEFSHALQNLTHTTTAGTFSVSAVVVWMCMSLFYKIQYFHIALNDFWFTGVLAFVFT